MPPIRKIIFIALGFLQASISYSQHPDRHKIDSLKAVLPSTHGINRIDCLNALSEEYWWPPHAFPDSISCWAITSNKDAVRLNYQYGLANSIMQFGVADIFRKNFRTAEKYLRQALAMFEIMQSDVGLAWCNLWLCQALHSENKFKEAIAFYVRSAPLLEKLHDWEGQGKAWAWMGFLYAATGDYDSSFYYCSKSLLIRQKMNDDVCVAAALTNMGHLYKVAGDYEDALDYYRQGLQYARTHSINLHSLSWNYLDEPMAVIYRLMNLPDSSIYYLQTALQIDPENQMTRINLGETFLAEKKYDSALTIFLKPIDHFREQNDQWDLMRILLNVAKAYYGKKNESAAKQYAWESISIAQKANLKQYLMEGYLLLSRLYNTGQKNDSAYFYLQHYTTLKDSVLGKQLVFRLSNYKKQNEFKKQSGQIELLDKENKAKGEKLKQASFFRSVLAISLLIVIISGFIIYKNISLKRKNDLLKNKHDQVTLQQQATRLEMQALKAQMNPHFIFNCLSSINSFILKNEMEAASDYLTKFSRLIRMALTNSNKTFISIEEELDTLKLYLDMERLRFKNSFDYNIIFYNSIDVNNVFIPPLLLQPFVENAIWHGLMHKTGQGKLEIALSVEDKVLTCIITDNGIGRDKAAMFKSKSAEKQKSMGLKITAERLALLNLAIDENNYFKVEDITDNEGRESGTRIILKMHYRNMIEDLVDQ